MSFSTRKRILSAVLAVLATIWAAGCDSPVGLDSGNGGDSSGDTSSPSEVTNLTAYPGSGELLLTWEDPAGSNYDGVQITWEPNGTDVRTVAAGIERYTVQNLTVGTDYTFTVRTVDSNRNASAGQTVTQATWGPDVFISQWLTDGSAWAATSNASNSVQIKLPLHQSGTYDFTVHWGDGTRDTITAWDQAEVTHTYPRAGLFEIVIDGTIEGFGFTSDGDSDAGKLLDIMQWGNVELHDEGGQFSRTANLTRFSAAGSPNLSNITNMSQMFYGAKNFNSDIGAWDVSGVTDMSNMFQQAEKFNADLSDWDVSAVTDMSGMFRQAHSFSADLSDWDVSQVTDMNRMFMSSNGESSFNSPIGSWDVSSVTNMVGMFYGTDAFNADIGGWDVSSVIDMAGMFRDAGSFNVDIGDWDVSNVVNFTYMLLDAASFNQDLSGWCTESVSGNPDPWFAGRSPLENHPEKLPDWGTCPVP